MSYPDTYPDIISVRSFISKQFPTLLAIREIIADALFFTLKNHTGSLLSETDALQHALFSATCRYLNAKIVKKMQSDSILKKKYPYIAEIMNSLE